MDKYQITIIEGAITTIVRMDGESFSIGDTVKMQGVNSPALSVLTIEHILLEEQASGGIALCGEGRSVAINVAEHIKQVDNDR